MNLTDLLPGHEIGLVIHPFVGDEKCRAKTQLFQQGRYEGAM